MNGKPTKAMEMITKEAVRRDAMKIKSERNFKT